MLPPLADPKAYTASRTHLHGQRPQISLRENLATFLQDEDLPPTKG